VSGAAVPAGYVRRVAGNVEIVAFHTELDAVLAARESASDGTLYGYASAHEERRAMQGRAPVYAVPLPRTGTRVVVRHAWHGGLLAPLTRDLFAPPTRAPHELRTALRLADAGVPTPDVVGFATYQAPFGLRRADVLTREVPDALDLAAALMAADDDQAKSAALAAAGTLLGALADAEARHPDLNIKNVLLAPTAGLHAAAAYVLDVDRIVIGSDRARVAAANLARLERSIAKWRAAGRIEVSDRVMTALRTAHPRATATAR
jgi:tRNA A-37 threonylcarbamoyl transferase component Bud32